MEFFFLGGGKFLYSFIQTHFLTNENPTEGPFCYADPHLCNESGNNTKPCAT